MALNWNKEITLGGAKEPDRSAADKVAQQGDEPTVPSTEDEIRDLRTDPTERADEPDISWQAAEGISDMRYGAAQDTADPAQDVAQTSTAELEPLSADVIDLASGPASEPTPEPVASSDPASASSQMPATEFTFTAEPQTSTSDAAQATIPEPVSATIPEPVSATLPVMPARPSEPADTAPAAPAADAQPQDKKKKGLSAILNQPIGGKKGAGSTGKRRGRGRGSDWPSKKTINLYVRQESSLDLRHAIPLAAGLAVLLLVFLKFGILDPLARVAALQGTLSQRQVELQQIDSSLTDYDEVKDTYDAYNVQTSSTGIDVLGTLNMVDTYVKPVAVVESEDLEGNVLTLGLSGANLDAYGNLATTLMAQSNVSGVSVSTADSKDSDSNENVKATLTVTLRTIAETNAQEAQADGSTAGANAASKDATGSSDASASSGASTSSDAASTSASTSSGTSAQSAATGTDATSN